MDLREKYSAAIQKAKELRMEGAAQQVGDKLHFKGTVSSQDEANRIWDAIKTVPDWSKEVVADITAKPKAPRAPGATGQTAGKTYTVKSGDTLSKIAQDQLGDAKAYHDIFNANRDQLTDPDEIKPGQVLKIPARSS